MVSHNKLLCKVLKAYINKKLCSSIKSIKYVCKYVNKGADMDTLTVEGDKGKR